MAVDILDPQYIISELIGNVVMFALLLGLSILYLAAKKKLPFQWILALVSLSFLMLPLIFDGFLSWVPIIVVVIGLIVGTIFYRFIERT